jgi:hypothetical protein
LYVIGFLEDLGEFRELAAVLECRGCHEGQ